MQRCDVGEERAWRPAVPYDPSMKYDTPEPFKVDIPERALIDLDERLRRWRPPIAIEDKGSWASGTDPAFLEELVEYWRYGYDWQRCQEAINRWPNYLVDIGPQRIHFIREPGTEVEGAPRPLPMVLTHGWPGSIVEFLQDVAGTDRLLPARGPARFKALTLARLADGIAEAVEKHDVVRPNPASAPVVRPRGEEFPRFPRAFRVGVGVGRVVGHRVPDDLLHPAGKAFALLDRIADVLPGDVHVPPGKRAGEAHDLPDLVLEMAGPRMHNVPSHQFPSSGRNPRPRSPRGQKKAAVL